MNQALHSLRSSLEQPLALPSDESPREQADRAVGWLLGYLDALGGQPAGRVASRAELEARLGGPPPENGLGFREVLAEFQEQVVPYGFQVAHPRNFAYIPTAPTVPSILADLLCSGTNFFCGTWLAGSGPAQVEIVVLDWFRQILGLPPKTQGILTSGGSEANLIALLVARERLAFEERPRAVLYLSEQRHGSVDRAARIAGLRPDQIRPVPADAEFRLQPGALAKMVGRDRQAGCLPWAVVANAGATNTGTVDPLAALGELCHRERLWFHVDAAYGWAAALVSEGREALDGIASADSVTLDPHKWFAQPYEVGCILVRDGGRLPATFGIRPDYMQDVDHAVSAEVHFADHGLALTRRFRALKVWMSVRALGLGWFRSLIERGCRLAEFAEHLLLQAPHFEIMSHRQLGVVCFRYRPVDRPVSDDELDRINLAVVEAVNQSGRALISSTRLRERVALRICFVNWRTTAGDVEEVVRLIGKMGSAVK
jgi:glutamate/tyrosine decarboxylase-like PLP-dependent enzyme